MGACCKKPKKEAEVPKEIIQDLSHVTKFTQWEVEQLYKLLLQDYPNGKISLEDLENEYRQMYQEGDPREFAKLIFATFDTNGDGIMDYREFIVGLSITSQGMVTEKLKWAFGIYDIDKSGYISKEEMVQVMTSIDKMVKGTDDPMERAHTIFDQMDANNDGRVSIDEFVNAIVNCPQLLSPIPLAMEG